MEQNNSDHISSHYDEGCAAYLDGKDLEGCPYAIFSQAHRHWCEGWNGEHRAQGKRINESWPPSSR